MHKLLKINNVDFPEPYGEFALNKNDKVNEYRCEDGTSTIEIIRTGVVDLKVAYESLTAEKVRDLSNALKTVSSVVVFDPNTNSTKTITAFISNVNVRKVYHRHELSVWSLSFDVKEL